MTLRRHWYVLAYDIRSAQRLQRLHRFLVTQAYALQESVFAWCGNDEELDVLKRRILTLIRPSEDDFRGYRVAVNTPLEFWGASPFLTGVFCAGYPPHRMIAEVPLIAVNQSAILENNR
jgi:CRISPR-associated endonuclease Cas2